MKINIFQFKKIRPFSITWSSQKEEENPQSHHKIADAGNNNQIENRIVFEGLSHTSADQILLRCSGWTSDQCCTILHWLETWTSTTKGMKKIFLKKCSYSIVLICFRWFITNTHTINIITMNMTMDGVVVVTGDDRLKWIHKVTQRSNKI